jgi:pullulanase
MTYKEKIPYEIQAERAAKRSDYGVTVHPSGNSSTFVVWAPGAKSVSIALYKHHDTYQRQVLPMEYDKSSDGCYVLNVKDNLIGMYYTYLVQSQDEERIYEVIDPYAKASGPNSKRGYIINPRQSDPDGFRSDLNLPSVDYGHAILYELSVRDFTSHSSSGVQHAGLYLGLTESGTSFDQFATGIDHLVELGVTHVHLMPVQDFISIDENTRLPYNWGYDPMLFDVPEGSYATDPYGEARIRELKQLIMALHQAGLRVVLDVVYNHTYHNHYSNYQRLAPNYYYRMTECGFSNGSGCGNEFATERTMARKRILDSLQYWVDEYRVDGFRFDLMGLFDRKTVELITKVLHQSNPDLMLYAEPWAAGHSTLPESERFGRGCQRGLGIAIFDDGYRDVLLGSPDGASTGYLQQGNAYPDENEMFNLRKGICAGIACAHHPGILADTPAEIIHYISSHDNLILRDKLEASMLFADDETRFELCALSFNLLLTSFGIPFIHSGTEFYRTKQGHTNSYNADDEINAIKWNYKKQYKLLHQHVCALIKFRKSTGLFSKSPEAIRHDIELINEGLLAYRVRNGHFYYDFYHNPSDVHIVLLNDQRRHSEVVLQGLAWYPEQPTPLSVPSRGSLILKTDAKILEDH